LVVVVMVHCSFFIGSCLVSALPTLGLVNICVSLFYLCIAQFVQLHAIMHFVIVSYQCSSAFVQHSLPIFYCISAMFHVNVLVHCSTCAC
jgi:hypothetical protein